MYDTSWYNGYSDPNGIAHSALSTDSAKYRMASRGALDKLEESSFIEVWVPGQSERVDHWVPSNRLLVVLNQLAILDPGLPMVCYPGNVTMQILNFWKRQNFLIIINLFSTSPGQCWRLTPLTHLALAPEIPWGHPEVLVTSWDSPRPRRKRLCAAALRAVPGREDRTWRRAESGRSPRFHGHVLRPKTMRKQTLWNMWHVHTVYLMIFNLYVYIYIYIHIICV